MSAQTLFNRTVGFHLPSAIPVQLERIDEFSLGKVLVYTKKPKRFAPWRKHELSFTGWSISSLLAAQPEDSPLKIATASSFMFDLGKGSSSATVNVNLDAELNLREALVNLDAKLKADEQKKLTITSDFGKVTRVSTDLLSSCSSKKLSVDTEHPIVQEAMEKGGAMFVITSMYTAERCNIQVNISDSKDESLAAGAKSSETVKDSDTTSHVLSRDQPTPIAYLLLRLVIGKHGEIKPQIKTYLRNAKAEYEVLSNLGAFPEPPLSKTVQVPPYRAQESQDFRDWIIIDIVEETSSAAHPSLPAAPTSQLPQADLTSGDPGTGGLVMQAPGPVMEVAVAEVSTDLGSALKQTSGAKVNTPYATPMSEIQKSAESAASASTAREEPDFPANDQQLHYVYSLKDFQPFESATYRGILGEVEEWVEPLVSNSQLHSAYLNYIHPPRTLEKLKTLTTFLLEYGNSLRTNKPAPASANKDVDVILTKLNQEVKVRLEEVTSLIVTSEALDEFPQFLVMKATELPNDKRQALIDVICQTPYGTDRHVYSDAGPYKDPDIYPFMTKMGFSLPSTEQHLVFTSGDDSEDILAAGLILLKATKSSHT